jgi:hypothetical protein
MSEERLKVLEMLANGRITVEQANQLLATLGLSDEPRNDLGLDEHDNTEVEDEAPDTNSRFGEWSFEQILEMSTIGVEPEYIRKVRDAGLTDLSFEQILQMGVLGVEPEFVLEARAAYPELSLDQIVQLSHVGVDPSFVRKVREAGLDDLSFDQIVHMGTVGVDPEDFKRVRAAASLESVSA